jgi:hypothetical protein
MEETKAAREGVPFFILRKVAGDRWVEDRQLSFGL